MAYRTARKTTLLCFSHLRWRFVMQRPQHLMARAARLFDVVFLEEPVFGEGAVELRVETVDGVCLAVPHLPHGLSDQARDAALSTLVAQLLDRRAPAIFWYYTPAAVAFSRHAPRKLTIYDNMDELSAFRGASPDLLRLEQELLESADLVFAGGWSLHEAKRSRHRSVHCLPSSVDVAHFGRARASGLPDPADQADLPHPRLGFFGVIDERMDLGFVAALAAMRPAWHFRDARPSGEDRSGRSAASEQRALARHEALRRAAGISRALGSRADALRAQRVDALHQPDQDA